MAIAKTNRILADGYNLASALKSIAPEIVSEELDATYLSSGARVYEMGYDAATVDAQGFFANDGTNLDRIHNILSLAFKNRTTQKANRILARLRLWRRLRNAQRLRNKVHRTD
jgi:hypothetical protein